MEKECPFRRPYVRASCCGALPLEKGTIKPQNFSGYGISQ